MPDHLFQSRFFSAEGGTRKLCSSEQKELRGSQDACQPTSNKAARKASICLLRYELTCGERTWLNKRLERTRGLDGILKSEMDGLRIQMQEFKPSFLCGVLFYLASARNPRCHFLLPGDRISVASMPLTLNLRVSLWAVTSISLESSNFSSGFRSKTC